MAGKAYVWTPERCEWLIAQVAEQIQRTGRNDFTRIAAAVGTTATGAKLRYQALARDGRCPSVADLLSRARREVDVAPAPQAPRATLPDIRDHLDIPPRPFAVPIPRKAGVKRGNLRTAIFYTDSHFPFQCDKTLAVIASLAEDLQPDVLIHGGDLLDAYHVSRFNKDPNRLHTLQDEIDMSRAHLHQMAQLCPNADRYVLEGNHEDRLRRTIWELPGGAAELARLTAFKEAMSWPVLLGLDEIGYTWVPTMEQSRKSIVPKLLTKHGTVVRKNSGYTARGEWEKYGRGGMSGHTHRLGGFYHRDHNGSICWWEAGCTCDLNPGYVMDPDWQNGCLVVTWAESDGRFSVEPVFIQDGEAIWRGDRLAA